MIEAGIMNESLLIVDKSLTANNGNVVLASINGDYTIKEFRKTGLSITLSPRNPRFKPIVITEDMDFSIWGVVTHSVVGLL